MGPEKTVFEFDLGNVGSKRESATIGYYNEEFVEIRMSKGDPS